MSARLASLLDLCIQEAFVERIGTVPGDDTVDGDLRDLMVRIAEEAALRHDRDFQASLAAVQTRFAHAGMILGKAIVLIHEQASIEASLERPPRQSEKTLEDILAFIGRGEILAFTEDPDGQ